MSEWSNDEVTEVLSEVARRASVDPDFRSLALRDPDRAISKVSTKPLPSELDIKFLDNSGKTKFVPLPDPIEGLEELSEAELEAIAGGDQSITGNYSQGPQGPTYAGSATWHR